MPRPPRHTHPHPKEEGMTMLDERRAALYAAADALDMAATLLTTAMAYPLDRHLRRRCQRVMKALGPVPGWRLKKALGLLP